jgi:hypothetical protein
MITLRAVTFARLARYRSWEWTAALAAWRMDDAWLGALLLMGDRG